jgi:predicted metal-binding membrane protein
VTAAAGAPVARREKGLALASLAAVAGLAWLYLLREAARMGSMEMTAMAPAEPWSPSRLLLTFLMWAVMMVGMMLPSAAPMLLLYGAMARKNAERAERAVMLAAVWVFAAGYLLVWTGFSLLATILQAALQSVALLSGSMTSASPLLSGILLVLAGLYQWLPAKTACLERCRSPLQFLLARWRPGSIGGLRMGAEHGLFCLGCCWALMTLLFAVGVMNLVWVAVIAGFVFVEKLLPAPRLTTLAAGTVLAAAGVYLIVASPVL